MTTIAIDIDGTIASIIGSTGFAHYINSLFGLSISSEWRARSGESIETQLMKEPAVADWATTPERVEELRDALKVGHYHPLVQEHALPMPGALEAVIHLAQKYTICYTTNRKQETFDVTQAWLTRHGFPHAERLHRCYESDGYIGKFKAAATYLTHSNERLFMIDDMPAQLERSFWRYVQQDIKAATPLLMHTAILAYGMTSLPPCPFSYPVLVMRTLPQWSEISQALVDCRPYLHKQFAELLIFFEPDTASTLQRERGSNRKIA